MKNLTQLSSAIVLALGMTGAVAQTSGITTDLDRQAKKMDSLAINSGQMRVADKTASSFITLAGSRDNAVALVTALRNGTAVTLASTTTGTGTGTTTGTGTGTGTTAGTGTGTGTSTATTFTPPTGKMGWGNVFISLALAQNALAQAGITHPTSAQLQAALTGGDVVGVDGKTVTLKGVLQLRADGMGWGQIAQAYGTRLGPVVSSIKSANRQIAVAGTSPTSTQTASVSTKTTAAGGVKSSKGLTTASATPAGSAGAKGLTTATGAVSGTGSGIVSADQAPKGHGNAFGKGVVTAAGGSGATAGVTSGAAGAGHGAVAGAGVVSAAGNAVVSGVTTAHGAGATGNGNGNGNGKAKGD